MEMVAERTTDWQFGRLTDWRIGQLIYSFGFKIYKSRRISRNI